MKYANLNIRNTKKLWLNVALLASCFFYFAHDVQTANSEVGSSANTLKKGTASQSKQGKSSLSGILGTKDKSDTSPVLIKSDSLTLQTKDRIFTYKGNVEMKRGDLLITTDMAVGSYDEQNQLQKVICERNVVITRGEAMRATSEKAAYNVQTAVIELTENPELTHNGSTLSADKVIIYVNEDRSVAQGEVRVKVLNTKDSSLKSVGSEASDKEKELTANKR